MVLQYRGDTHRERYKDGENAQHNSSRRQMSDVSPDAQAHVPCHTVFCRIGGITHYTDANPAYPGAQIFHGAVLESNRGCNELCKTKSTGSMVG